VLPVCLAKAVFTPVRYPRHECRGNDEKLFRFEYFRNEKENEEDFSLNVAKMKIKFVVALNNFGA
jgi:hypothetical protein